MAVKDLAAGVWKPFGWSFRGHVEPRNENSKMLLPSKKYYIVEISYRRASPRPSAKCRDTFGVTRIRETDLLRVAREFQGGICHGLGITILFHRALIIRPAIAILCEKRRWRALKTWLVTVC